MWSIKAYLTLLEVSVVIVFIVDVVDVDVDVDVFFAFWGCAKLFFYQLQLKLSWSFDNTDYYYADWQNRFSLF